MKSSLHFIIFAFIGGSPFGFAGDEQTSIAKESAPEVATARIIGDLPDGTPPPPQPRIPTLSVRAGDVLETKTHQQGGRQIIVRKLSPVTVPPPRKPSALPVDITSPALQQRIGDTLEKHPDVELLMVGASVFHARDGTARSFVGVWPQGKGEPVTFWSSADFGYLSGFCSFAGTDGESRSLIMAWSIVDIGDLSELTDKRAAEHGVPAVPEFPAGKAAFTLSSGKPDAETLRSIQSLHDLYNNEYQRLKTASEGRQRAAREHQAELIANPPQPRDIILNTWPIESAAPTKAKGASK